MASGSVGERIAAYRRRRGLSQTALAGLVGRSESWLSQVERGIRSVDRLSVLLDLAKVLHVDVEALTGAPWQYAPNGGSVPDSLSEVRQFLSRYDSLLGVAPDRPTTVPELDLAVTAAHEAYQAARYEDVIAGLPALLSQADSLHRTAFDGRRDVLIGYSAAYALAAKLLTKVGAGDLSILAADRCATAAVEADSMTARGLAAYQVVCALLRSERPEDAEPLAVGMAEEAQRNARADRPTLASVAGSLWLIAAVIASRRTEQAEAWRRLDQAQALADMLGADGNHAWTAFGPTNVGIHRVSVAAELGDPAAALRAAESVDLDRLPKGLKSRRAQMHLHLGWAEAQRKRDADAVLHLLEAERIAPESVRYNVIVGELVRGMLARQKRGGRTSALHNLALRAGVLR
ncbi:helix-turn-helix transcriptional regulator [Actinoplanes sp. NPDC051861]|uniref:helix-turn-helix domain-containing protein n=1 Tax=Actinoplanes sp. NPDC051861 TaxID=3155170 RepID=UPI00342B781B